jgi:hypothetical protein
MKSNGSLTAARTSTVLHACYQCLNLKLHDQSRSLSTKKPQNLISISPITKPNQYPLGGGFMNFA